MITRRQPVLNHPQEEVLCVLVIDHDAATWHLEITRLALVPDLTEAQAQVAVDQFLRQENALMEHLPDGYNFLHTRFIGDPAGA